MMDFLFYDQDAVDISLDHPYRTRQPSTFDPKIRFFLFRLQEELTTTLKISDTSYREYQALLNRIHQYLYPLYYFSQFLYIAKLK